MADMELFDQLVFLEKNASLEQDSLLIHYPTLPLGEIGHVYNTSRMDTQRNMSFIENT